MGLTSSLFTALSGLNTNQFRIDVIGDNIANVNTTAFKSSRSIFETQFAQTLSTGTPPGNTEGGSNPMSVGMGAAVAATQQNMLQGSIETTGVPSDLAIEGQGFFVVRSADNRQAYTRDGSFSLNAQNQLVTADGFFVQGFAVDDDFNIVPGVLVDLTIPLGSLSTARATESAVLNGNLSPTGPASQGVATTGTVLQSNALVSDAGGTPALATDNLTDLRDASDPSTTLFSAGDVITLDGATKGGRDLPTAQFVVGTTGTTLGDLADWLEDVLGINTTAGVPGSPGVTIDGSGRLVVTGNLGEENALQIAASALSSSGSNSTPLSFSETAAADGNSVFTSFTVFDSLGSAVQVNVTMVLESTSTTGNTWRFYAESSDDADMDLTVGTGTVTFDAEGKLTAATGTSLQIDRDGTGAADPLSFTLDFSSLTGLDTGQSSLVLASQDGFPPGTLDSFSIGTDGTISGTFTNGLTRTLGRIALATFANPAGLVRETNNLFRSGPNSGEAIITAPLVMGAGRIISGALELSNVDLSREFIGLIAASTGFSAAGRVIATSDELLNELLLLTR